MLWAASPTEPGFPPRGRAHAGGSGRWLRLPLAGLPGPPCAQACLLPDKEWHDCMQEGVCGVLGYRDLCLQGQTQRGPWARPFSRPVALTLVRAIRAHPPWPWLVISVPAVEGPGRGSVSLVARPSCVLSWWSWKSGVGRTQGGGAERLPPSGLLAAAYSSLNRYGEGVHVPAENTGSFRPERGIFTDKSVHLLPPLNPSA